MHAAALLPLLAALPLSQAANLLPSGDFEKGNWGSWTVQPGGGGKQAVVSPGYNSDHAGAHNINTRDGAMIANHPTINNLTIGRQYNWSVDYKLNNPGCTTEFANYEGTLILLGQQGEPVENGTWASYHGTFFARRGNESLSIATYCNVDASSPAPHAPTAEFDNFVLEAVDDTVYNDDSPATGPNLIVDPNAESGTLKAYNISKAENSTAKVFSPGYNGSAHGLEFTEVGVAPLPSYAIVTQLLPDSKKDTVYRVSMAIRVLKKEPQLCYIETYIQEAGFTGSTDVSSTTPFQTAFEFPPASQIIPPVGEWGVYDGLVSGISDGFEFAMTVTCISGTAKFEVGDIQVVPLN